MAGFSQLLEDLRRLSEDQDSADILFLVGKNEDPVYAHRLLLKARCKNFQIPTRKNEVCKVPGLTTIRLPNFTSNVFNQFVLYVYTAKIILQDSKLFEMMVISYEMGMEELKQICEDHVISTLSVSNACLFLQAIIDISEKSIFTSLMDKCLTFIGENAADCVNTNAFLSLSQEALIKIISSDRFYFEEENVWRSVLLWAKHQAGVTQPTLHWSEEEKKKVCSHLAPLMHFVRFLLIDSTVFAEEVEPTGAVPIEHVLERYKFAALNANIKTGYYNNVSNNQISHLDRRFHLQPRMNGVIFPESLILKNDKSNYQMILHKYIGLQKQSWKLLFRASTHGYIASKFHQFCDGIAPLYIIAIGAGDRIAGGYTDVPFTKGRKSGYIPSDKAFLFVLSGGESSKYDIVKKKYAICYHPNCGPIFGAGADLLISTNCKNNNASYSNLPHSYNGSNATSSSLFGDYNFIIEDYEVFTVSAKN